jgi:hypothetical protein
MSLKIKEGELEARKVNSIGSNAEKNVCSYLVTRIHDKVSVQIDTEKFAKF